MDIMNNVMTGTYFKGEESFNFNFYTNISSAMKLEYVNSVVETLVDEYHYNSIIRDLISDFYIISIFTDVDVVELSQSETFLEDVEQFLDETNIVEIVKANMREGLLEELNKAVSLSISYLTGIHVNPISESLSSLLSTIEKKIKNIDLGSIDLSGAMDMMQKLVGASADITPESIVNAYINSGLNQNV